MAALAILAAIAATTPASLPTAACGPPPVVQTSSTAPAPHARKLGDLPDGHLMKAVLLKVGPCSMKIVREPAGLNPGVWRYEADGPAAAKALPANVPAGR